VDRYDGAAKAMRLHTVGPVLICILNFCHFQFFILSRGNEISSWLFPKKLLMQDALLEVGSLTKSQTSAAYPLFLELYLTSILFVGERRFHLALAFNPLVASLEYQA